MKMWLDGSQKAQILWKRHCANKINHGYETTERKVLLWINSQSIEPSFQNKCWQHVFLQTTDMWRLSLFLSAQTHLKSKTVSKERDVIWTWYDLHCKNINMVYMTRKLCSSTSRFVFSGPADFTLHGSLDACLEQQPSWSYTFIYINPCCLRLTMTEVSVKNHTAVLGSLQVKT